MSTAFVNVLKQAKITFDGKKNNAKSFAKNFLQLKQLVDQMTVKDLDLNDQLFSKEIFQQPEKAPCTYIKIYENDKYTMSVFILADSYTMPLHDHPRMHGILRTIAGKLKIQSYSNISSTMSSKQTLLTTSEEEKEEDARITTTSSQSSSSLANHHFHHPSMNDNNNPSSSPLRTTTTTIVKCDPIKLLSKYTESAILTPNDSNYHEITAIEGPAAFFDVLSPPYGTDIPIFGPRKCSFYQKYLIKNVDSSGDSRGDHRDIDNIIKDTNIIQLVEIPPPYHFYCDNVISDLPNLQI